MNKEMFEFLMENFDSVYEDFSDTVIIYQKSEENVYKIVKANTSFLMVSGFSKRKIINRDIRRIFNDDISMMIISLFKKAASTKEKILYETTINIPSGSISWQITIEPYFYNNEEYFITKSTNISNKRELLETIKRLKTISQVAKIGGWEFNPGSGRVFWTEEMYNIFEVDYTFKPTPDSIKNFFPEYDLADINNKFLNSYKTGTPYDFITHFITAKQRHLWVRLVVNPFISDGKIKFLHGVLQDVTQLKQMEIELEMEKCKLNEILETQQEIICRSTPDTTILYANHAYAEYFYTTPEDLIGKPFIDFIPIEERHTVFETINQFNWNNRIIRNEHMIKKPDGSIRWMEWTDYGLFDEFGNLVEVQSQGKDITEKKVLELEIMRSETLYKSLVQASPNGIVLFDINGDICYTNKNMCLLLECDENELYNSNINEWLYKKVRNIKSFLKRMARNHFKHNLELRLISAKQKIITAEIFISIMNLQFEGIRFLIIVHDVTEKKQMMQNKSDMEKLLNHTARLSTISALSAGITHEINQPLSAMKVMIDGMIYLKKNNYDTFLTTIEEKLGFASQQISRIENIIDHLRGMIYNKPDTNFTHFDLHQSITNVFTILSTQMKNHNISFEFAPWIPQIMIIGYPIQFEQIMINLLNNAIYALDEDTTNKNKKIKISTRLSNNLVTIRIANNGKPLPKDEIERIFEPFFSTKPQGMGSGLGLTICQQLITSFGGNISVRNLEPRGVEFIIIVPENKR